MSVGGQIWDWRGLSRKGFPARTVLFSIIVLGTLPPLVFAGFLFMQYTESERARAESGLMAAARGVARAIDTEFTTAIASHLRSWFRQTGPHSLPRGWSKIQIAEATPSSSTPHHTRRVPHKVESEERLSNGCAAIRGKAIRTGEVHGVREGTRA